MNMAVFVTWRTEDYHIQLFNRKQGRCVCLPRMVAAGLP